ncbi:MAG: hypothetical protein PHH26_07795 [Candidatus Thermoplasmatota archaeon]|nr:hypothetical protein [Candidatus Thermoplasmatota archaeon]
MKTMVVLFLLVATACFGAIALNRTARQIEIDSAKSKLDAIAKEITKPLIGVRQVVVCTYTNAVIIYFDTDAIKLDSEGKIVDPNVLPEKPDVK